MSRVQSIERAFAVLGALADGPIGVTDVAERTGLPKSTAARLLASLAREGVVEQVPGETHYRLGQRLVTLASRIRPAGSLAAIARPALTELAATVGEAAGLSVADGHLVHYIDQVSSPRPVLVRDWTGSRIPMHAVSSGQVLLAFAPPVFVQRYLGRPLERFTDRTLVAASDLLERMRRIRRDGYAWALEEFDEGIASIAAPVADGSGEVVAAVHVHGPSYRFPAAGSETGIADRVIATAARIAGSLRTGSLPG
jgi:DNA-binding IclR family transcriptional regulator